MRILLVEDEARIARAVAEVLKKHNLAVDLVYDGNTGFDYAQSETYDAIVLDIMLPGIDGIALTEKLRRKGITTPIILLTARSSLEDKLAGFKAGADDYLTKPFHSEELLARIQALVRRGIGIARDGRISFGDLSLSPQRLCLECRESQISLTVKTSQLLELLIAGKGSIVPKGTILVKLWGYDADVEANHVEAHVSLLRKSLEKVGTTVRIRTVRGIGYALEAKTESRVS